MKTFFDCLLFFLFGSGLCSRLRLIFIFGEELMVLLCFFFFTDLGVLIYSVLEDHGVWEYVSVYVSQLLL